MGVKFVLVFVGGASAASEATLSSRQSRFAIYVGIVVAGCCSWDRN